MPEQPEEFRYVYPSGARSFPFRAISIEDAVAFTQLQFCRKASKRTALGRLECLIGGAWQALPERVPARLARTRAAAAGALPW